MLKELKHSLLPAIGLPLLFTSCDDDDEKSNADLLLGEWKVIETEVDGKKQIENYEYDGYEYNVVFEFEADGDFSSCYSYDDYIYCYSGSWEFQNTAQTELALLLSYEDEEDYITNMDIVSLTDEQLILESEFEYYEEISTIEITFRKQ